VDGAPNLREPCAESHPLESATHSGYF